VTGRARLALLLIALLAIVFAVYAPVRRGVFVLGDRSLVEANPLVEHGTASQIFTQPYAPVNPLSESRPVYYRPLTLLSLRADFALAGNEAGSYHVTNLLLHLATTIALLLAARRLGASPFASVIAAGVWALLPRSTECVAWISGRSDLLAAFFAIAAVGGWPWYAEAETENVETTATRVRAALAGLAVMCGLLAKEVAVAAAFAIVAGTVAGARGSTRERARKAARRLPYLVVPLLAYAALRGNATRAAPSRISSVGAGPRAQAMLESVGRYVEMTLDPFHPSTTIGLASEPDTHRMVLGGIVLAACAFGAVRALGRRSRTTPARMPPSPSRVAVLVAAALGAGALVLVVHIVPIVLVSAVAADRLLYLPLAGLALSAAIVAERLSPRHRRIAGGCALVLAATFVPVTRARARDYTDDLRFRVVAAEQAHPHNPNAKRALGLLLLQKSEVELACRIDASAARALARLGPSARSLYLGAQETLAACFARLGEYDDAARLYAKVRAERPDARVHMEIGFVDLHRFHFDDAEVSFRRAVALDPSLAPARDALAALPTMRTETARLATEDARRADRLGWARLLTNVGRVRDATAAWYECALDPATSNDAAFLAAGRAIKEGDLAMGRRVAEGYTARDANTWRRERLDALVAARSREVASVDPLRGRLEALAAQ
jgi:tetratricopeptide (TPR) repeat protein